MRFYGSFSAARQAAPAPRPSQSADPNLRFKNLPDLVGSFRSRGDLSPLFSICRRRVSTLMPDLADHRHDGPLGFRATAGPGLDKRPALLEQIAMTIGSLRLVLDGVRELHLHDMVRKVRALCRPVAKRRSEPVQ